MLSLNISSINQLQLYVFNKTNNLTHVNSISFFWTFCRIMVWLENKNKSVQIDIDKKGHKRKTSLNFRLTSKYRWYSTTPYTQPIDTSIWMTSHTTTLHTWACPKSSLPFLMHNMDSVTIMAPYTQHCVPTRLQFGSVTYM